MQYIYILVNGIVINLPFNFNKSKATKYLFNDLIAYCKVILRLVWIDLNDINEIKYNIPNIIWY